MRVAVSLVLWLTVVSVDAALVGRWKLDEGTGTTAADASGNGHNGSLIASPQWITNGIASNALSFATNSYVSVAHSTDLNVIATNTLSVWIKPIGPGQAGPGYSQFFTKGDSYYSGWGLRYTDDRRVIFQVTGQWGNSLATYSLPTNRWSHVVATVESIFGRLYVDGQLQQSGVMSGYKSSNTNGVSIGNIDGFLDDPRVYNHALSEQDVLQLFLEQDRDGDGLVDANEVIFNTQPDDADSDNDGYTDGQEVVAGTDPTNSLSAPDLSTGLVGHWKLDEGTGTITADSSGSGYTGQLVNGPGWAAGVISNAADFGHASNYIRAHPTGVVTGAFTVAVFSKPVDTWSVGLLDTLAPGFSSFMMELASYDDSFFWVAARIGNGDEWIVDGAGADYRWVEGWQWQHIGYTVTPTNFAVYAQGAQLAAGTYSNAVPLLFNGTQSVTNLTIGGGWGGEWWQPLSQGLMDDVRVYSRALTPGELALLANMDTDGDGISDRQETRLGTNSSNADSDGDGLVDQDEIRDGLSPTDSDTDGDGLPDGVDVDPVSYDHSSPSFTITYPTSGTTVYP